MRIGFKKPTVYPEACVEPLNCQVHGSRPLYPALPRAVASTHQTFASKTNRSWQSNRHNIYRKVGVLPSNVVFAVDVMWTSATRVATANFFHTTVFTTQVRTPILFIVVKRTIGRRCRRIRGHSVGFGIDKRATMYGGRSPEPHKFVLACRTGTRGRVVGHRAVVFIVASSLSNAGLLSLSSSSSLSVYLCFLHLPECNTVGVDSLGCKCTRNDNKWSCESRERACLPFYHLYLSFSYYAPFRGLLVGTPQYFRPIF